MLLRVLTSRRILIRRAIAYSDWNALCVAPATFALSYAPMNRLVAISSSYEMELAQKQCRLPRETTGTARLATQVAPAV